MIDPVQPFTRISLLNGGYSRDADFGDTFNDIATLDRMIYVTSAIPSRVPPSWSALGY